MQLTWCLFIPFNFWIHESIFTKPDTYIVAPEIINLSKQSVCLHVYFTIVATQRLGKHFTVATITRNNRITERGFCRIKRI
jgi:hypothetical protein